MGADEKHLKITFSLLFYPFELETGLFDGLADVAFGGGASDNQGAGGGSSLARDDAFHFADGLFTGGLAVVAVHAFDGINHGVCSGLLFFEFAEEFHTQCDYDEQN